MTIAAVIVAAGRGTRAGGEVSKQWRMVAGRRVVDWSVAAFAAHPLVNRIVLVVAPDTDPALIPSGVDLAIGGDTRSASVLAGLQMLDGTDTGHVLIHDVARPGISQAVIDRIITALDTHTGAAPALAVTDALWRGCATVTGTQSRENLWRAQTPQGFALPAILAAHSAATGTPADDVEVARAAGLDVAIVAGDEANMKITGPDDFARVAQYLEQTTLDIRVGNGFDVHRFGPGDHVMLCGVRVPHNRSLQGHSDADVGMHTVTDAIYGALAEGDIGQHFPPSDPQWKGAESHIFLRHACGLARSRGFTISNADCTLICEEPKVGPHALAMREKMSEIMGLEMERISVKATTSEKLGFTGRGEGIACQATVTLVKP